MKQDLFEEIGKLAIREEHCGEEEISRIYSLVMEKKRGEKNAMIKKIKILMISFAAVAAIVCISSIHNRNVQRDIADQAVPYTADDAVTIEKNDRIVVSVYAAQDKNQVVTENYAKELTMQKIKTGETANIGTYSLLSSSVPGYPLMVNDEKEKNNGQDMQIKIETDGGSLLSWDAQTGEVTDKGQSASFDSDENIYWSPLDHEKFAKEVNLKIVMYEENKIIGETLLHIYEAQEASYVLERVK